MSLEISVLNQFYGLTKKNLLSIGQIQKKPNKCEFEITEIVKDTLPQSFLERDRLLNKDSVVYGIEYILSATHMGRTTEYWSLVAKYFLQNGEQSIGVYPIDLKGKTLGLNKKYPLGDLFDVIQNIRKQISGSKSS